MEIIERIDHKRGKLIVFFESGWQVYLDSKDFPAGSLHEGMEINKDTFEKVIVSCQYPKALEKAISMLAMKPCTKAEITRKLKLCHFEQNISELVIRKLEKEQLLNDDEFSMQWVQSRMKKYGSSRIYMELVSKGIDRDTAETALADCTEDVQLENAVRFVEKKLKNKTKETDRSRLFRQITGMLMRRGYSWEISKKAFSEAYSENTDE